MLSVRSHGQFRGLLTTDRESWLNLLSSLTLKLLYGYVCENDLQITSGIHSGPGRVVYLPMPRTNWMKSKKRLSNFNKRTIPRPRALFPWFTLRVRCVTPCRHNCWFSLTTSIVICCYPFFLRCAYSFGSIRRPLGDTCNRRKCDHQIIPWPHSSVEPTGRGQ